MRDPPFILREPAGTSDPEGTRARVAETALIVEIPHAGVFVPPPFMPELVASARAIGRDADLYVDDLYEEAHLDGASMLIARTSRYVVDLNRAEDDVDSQAALPGQVPSSPRGVIWRITTEGDRSLTGPLSKDAFEQRLKEIYRPYHAALRALIRRKLDTFGRAVVLAAHSMPSVARKTHGDAGQVRADVVPGSRGRTSAAAKYIDAVDAHARGRGWSVAHDEPYKGGFTTQHYGRPRENVHVVQVELARRLYMDEAAYRRLPGAFDDVRAWCRELARTLGKLSLE
jgi:N-formylglutamate deformylase